MSENSKEMTKVNSKKRRCDCGRLVVRVRCEGCRHYVAQCACKPVTA